MTEPAIYAHAQLDQCAIIAAGPDRLDWLNGLVTCELKKREVGDAVYGLAVAKNGKITAELWIVVAEDALVVGVRADLAQSLFESFDRHLIMEDVELTVDTSMKFQFLYGEGAMAVVDQRRAQSSAADIFAGGTRRAGLSMVVVASKTPLDWGPEVEALDEPAWHRMRIQHGIPQWGRDFDSSNYPQEAALERDAVSFDKGCYLGQEAVFMLEKRGHVKKRLVQLRISGASPLPDGTDLQTPDGVSVGAISSSFAVDSHTVALGIVKYKQAKADTELVASSRTAVVTELLAIGANVDDQGKISRSP